MDRGSKIQPLHLGWVWKKRGILDRIIFMNVKRDFKRQPYIIGITGVIGSGKSTACLFLKARGVPLFDADQVVHHLLRNHPTVRETLWEKFPQVWEGPFLERHLLGNELLRNPSLWKDLEDLIHPYVQESLHRFIKKHQQTDSLFVVLEIPLLYELGWDIYCDSVIVMSCSAKSRKARLLKRPGMTEEKYEMIQGRQLSQEEKCRRASHILSSDQDRHLMLHALLKILFKIRSYHERNCPRHRNHRT